MIDFLKYLKAQLKRAVKMYPVLLSFTLILSICLVLFVSTLIESYNNEDENNIKFKVGIVGDTSETYLGIGISAVTTLDSSKQYVEFITLDEKSAKDKLTGGELVGYVVVPDNFVKSVVNGKNARLTYFAANSPSTVGPILINEVVNMVSELIIESQNGIYGLFALDDASGDKIPAKHFNNTLEKINIEYIQSAISRDTAYDVVYVGIKGGLSFEDYYLIAAVIIVMLLWGILSAPLIIKKDLSLARLLYSGKRGVTLQIIGDYIPFVLIFVVNSLILFGIISGYINYTGIPEKSAFSILSYENLPNLFICILPVILLITALQFFLYEITTNIISGVLIQIFAMIALSFSSGLFYPLYSLPKTLRSIADFLPTTVAFEYLSAEFFVSTAENNLLLMLIWTLIFILAAMVARKAKLRSSTL